MKSTDKFTVIKSSEDGVSIYFIIRSELEANLANDYYGTDPRFDPAPDSDAGKWVDPSETSCFYIIPGWPVVPERKVVKVALVLP